MKKILYSLVLFISLFIATDVVKAEICPYESGNIEEAGGKIKLEVDTSTKNLTWYLNHVQLASGSYDDYKNYDFRASTGEPIHLTFSYDSNIDYFERYKELGKCPGVVANPQNRTNIVFHSDGYNSNIGVDSDPDPDYYCDITFTPTLDHYELVSFNLSSLKWQDYIFFASGAATLPGATPLYVAINKSDLVSYNNFYQKQLSINIKFKGWNNRNSKLCAKFDYQSDDDYDCVDFNSILPVMGNRGDEVRLGFKVPKINGAEYYTISEYFEANMKNGKCPKGFGEDIFVEYKNKTFYLVDQFHSVDDIEQFVSSSTYKKHLENLKTPLEALAISLEKTSVMDYSGLTLDNENIKLSDDDIDYGTGICKKDNCSEPLYQTGQALKAVKQYCNELNLVNSKLYNTDTFKRRREECSNFNSFYNRLVSEGIISNLAEGCGFISTDLRGKLNNILNLVKVAGPILAIVLGMLDFTKVLIAGDAEKESKDAWKRFKIRLFAAALLFVIPFLLQIPLNGIMGSEKGYDKNNPFCEVGK